MHDRELKPDSVSKIGIWVLSLRLEGAKKLLLLLYSCSVARKREVQNLGQVPHCLGDYVCIPSISLRNVRPGLPRSESGQEGDGQVEAKEKVMGERERKKQISAQRFQGQLTLRKTVKSKLEDEFTSNKVQIREQHQNDFKRKMFKILPEIKQ